MGNDATRCYVCGGEFSTKRTIIEGRAAHEGCAVMSYPPHTADAMAKMHDALQTEIERLLANQERMWCKACGMVTRDRQCDCTKCSDQDTQSLVNYADAMQKSAHEEAQENERLLGAIKGVEIALARDGDVDAAMKIIVALNHEQNGDKL